MKTKQYIVLGSEFFVADAYTKSGKFLAPLVLIRLNLHFKMLQFFLHRPTQRFTAYLTLEEVEPIERF